MELLLINRSEGGLLWGRRDFFGEGSLAEVQFRHSPERKEWLALSFCLSVFPSRFLFNLSQRRRGAKILFQLRRNAPSPSRPVVLSFCLSFSPSLNYCLAKAQRRKVFLPDSPKCSLVHSVFQSFPLAFFLISRRGTEGFICGLQFRFRRPAERLKTRSFHGTRRRY